MFWALMILFLVLWVLGMVGVLQVGMWTWLFGAAFVICLIGQFTIANRWPAQSRR